VDGSVFCWGSNQAGQLGDGTGVDHPLVPTKVAGLKAKAAKVVASKATTCALLVTGEVQCWGANDKGQLGVGSADFLPHLQPGSVVAFQ
jgi:alpha-tubulin suppressor-like RCC1 family protein